MKVHFITNGKTRLALTPSNDDEKRQLQELFKSEVTVTFLDVAHLLDEKLLDTYVITPKN
jgi:hypothetical protein